MVIWMWCMVFDGGRRYMPKNIWYRAITYHSLHFYHSLH